ncbi:hypothetical protein V6N13_101054 [Hibiscus sabdariffa]|uniref:Response regulatory domain-containing protein n=1 Tax=Hibiscus sabdariffa TaxID=183260 RepID=A0ABR2QKA8_9ROSI
MKSKAKHYSRIKCQQWGSPVYYISFLLFKTKFHPVSGILLEMAVNGAVTWLRRAGEMDGYGLSASDTEEVHVLAVDDSQVDRKVIERLLKITSCKVTAVDSGRRALQFLGLDDEKEASNGFDGLKVDLIITDYCMPGMTGYELLKKVKESSVFREIPVVIMSSENVITRIDRCLEEGAEDFIVKPVKLSDVKRIIDCMMTDLREGGGGRRGINKRKLRDDGEDRSSSSPPSTLSSSSSSTAPCSPTTVDSPTRRLKMTSFEEHVFSNKK